MSEVPRDLICAKCALTHRRSLTNILACTHPSHKRPSNQSIIYALESWIPGLSLAGLGVRLSVDPRMQPGKPVQRAKQKLSEKALEQKTVEQQEETVVQQLESQPGKKKAAVQQQEVTLELEEAAVAAPDTGGAGFYTHRARATLPC